MEKLSNLSIIAAKSLALSRIFAHAGPANRVGAVEKRDGVKGWQASARWFRANFRA